MIIFYCLHTNAVPQCQHVLYAVRSHDKHETSNIVTACLEQQQKTDSESREYIHSPDTTPTCDGGYHFTCMERKVTAGPDYVAINLVDYVHNCILNSLNKLYG